MGAPYLLCLEGGWMQPWQLEDRCSWHPAMLALEIMASFISGQLLWQGSCYSHPITMKSCNRIPHAWVTNRKQLYQGTLFRASWGALHTSYFLCFLVKWHKTKPDLKLSLTCLNRSGSNQSWCAVLVTAFDNPDLHLQNKGHILPSFCAWIRTAHMEVRYSLNENQLEKMDPGLGLCYSHTSPCPSTQAILIISLQLITSVSIKFIYLFIFHGKVRNHFERVFPRYCVHYFLINLIGRFSHDMTGELIEITAEQSPFMRIDPLWLPATPFCDILWFWQKFSFWSLKELY